MPRLIDLAGSHRRLALVLFGLGVTLYVALLCASAATRKPWNDEAMSADAGYNLGFRGYDGVAFYDPSTPGNLGTTKHSYYIFPLQLCVLALWYHLVPFSVFYTRVLSMLWTGALLTALYHAVRKMTADPAIAFLTVILTAFNYNIMIAGSFGRYDPMVAALGFGAYAVYLAMRERRLRWAIFLANALVFAACATHPNGVFYFTGLWFLIFYYDRRRIGWLDIVTAAVPYCIGGAMWAAYVFQDFHSFQVQLGANSAGRVGLLHPLRTMMLEFRGRIIPVYGLGLHSAGHDSPWIRLKVLGLVAIVLGILVCLLTPAIRRNRDYLPYFCLTGIHLFLMTFSETMKFSYYLIHLLPLLCGVIAIAAAYLWRTRNVPRWALAGAIGLLILVETAGIAAKVRLDDYRKVYLPAVEYVKEHAKPEDEIFAVCSFGFAYGFDTKMIDDQTFGYYSGKRPIYIVLEEIYDDSHNRMKTSMPDKYRHVTQMLNSYKLVYRNSEYRVYQRSDPRATS